MVRQALILFTDSYPFARGEEFLEQEITYHEGNFDRTIIIPTYQKDTVEQTRELPDGMEALLVTSPRTEDWRKFATKHAARAYLGKHRMVGSRIWNGFYPWLIDFRFATTAIELYKRIEPHLKKIDWSEYDRVVIYSYWFYTGTAVGVMIRDLLLPDVQVDIVSRAHAYDVDESDAAYQHLPARKFLMRNATEVYPISDYAAAFLRKYEAPGTANIVIRRLGVPANNVATLEREDELRIVSCSHFAPYKRIDLLVETLGELAKRGIKFYWTHIGESTPEMNAPIHDAARRLLPEGSYTFTGYLPNDEVRAYYADSQVDLFMNVSNGEGVPVTIMEALAAGIPVLATDAGGTREIVHDGRNGWIIPVASSAAEIAEKLAEVAAIPADRYREFGKQAHEVWAEYSDRDVNYQRFADTFADAEYFRQLRS